MRQRPGIAYGARWHPQQRAIDEPLPAADAERRHGAGEPYVVLLGPAGRPRHLVEVDGLHARLLAWSFDELQRRTFRVEFRQADRDRMALLEMTEWRYPDASAPEFDTDVPRCLTTFGSEITRPGRDAPIVQAIGTPTPPFRALGPDERWIAVPRFGSWSGPADFLSGLPQPPFPVPEPVETLRDFGPLPHPPAPPRAPQPRPPIAPPVSEPVRDWAPGAARPGPEMVTMFGPPARYLLEAGESEPGESEPGEEVVVQAREVGRLQLPTGRLLVTDPAYLGADLQPLTVALPTGSHPVTVAIATFPDRTEKRVAGCRISLREEPVAYWEPALQPGQDPSTLGDGQYFVVGVDSGVLAFTDAVILHHRLDPSSGWYEVRGVRDELRDELWRERSVVMEDPDTATNMIVFPSGFGDGGYPVWIGRCAEHDVVCVVADTEVLAGSTLVGPVEPG
ncbi:DUF4241 domain-containing protein [Pseudonocardia sp. GCM10023141]|uniref:DUF4241 domain-containing protein n=1 Tax=Pseudonocardia sp. GCM10023141 TaxID=3252653 RepID=UPI003605DE7C